MQPPVTMSLFVLLALVPTVTGIATYYMDVRCGTTLSFPAYGLQAIRLKLTSRTYYQSNMDCYLNVNTTYPYQFMIYFRSLNIETSATCSRDWLEVRDGSSKSSPYVGGINTRLCGSLYNTYIYRTKGGALTLRFHSDNSFGERGFDMILTAYHTGYCYSNEYDCDNGRCISEHLQCNGYNPCGDHSDCPLSAGSIAGIVIGCFFVVVVFATILVLVRRRRRHRPAMHTYVNAATQPYGSANQYPTGPQYPPQTAYPPAPAQYPPN